MKGCPIPVEPRGTKYFWMQFARPLWQIEEDSSAPFCRSVLGDGILLFPYSGAGCSWFNCFRGQRFVFLWQLAPVYDECCSNAWFSLCSL